MPIDPTMLTGAAKVLAKPLNDLYEGAKGITKTKLKKWEIEKNITTLHKRISVIQKVKTIWQIDKYVNLKSFYYPSKIQIEDSPQEIAYIEKIPCDTNIVIQGTVGQGKSIFLRYMCLQELKISKRIPVFFELRNLEKGRTIQEHIAECLDCLGFPRDEISFDYLMRSGKIILLLDAFDEIEPSLCMSSIRELERFTQKYENTKIVITSRPDSGIENSPLFTVFKLCPLEISDLTPLLNKYFSDEKKSKEIFEAIKSNKNNIAGLLTTPLMVSLLVFSYKSEGKIPESLTEFYERLFETLLSRHDGTKPGYERKRKSKLSDSEMRIIFDAFCFFSKNLENTYLTKRSSIEAISNASESTRIRCKPDDFFVDIVKITCLILEDGFDRYKFLHKSIQEFYAASFIAGRPNEAIIKFYGNVLLNEKCSRWEQELSFLSELDKFRYRKYYLSPSMTQILIDLGMDPAAPEASDTAADNLTNGIALTLEVGSTFFAWGVVSDLFGKSEVYRRYLLNCFPNVMKAVRDKDQSVQYIHGVDKESSKKFEEHLKSLGISLEKRKPTVIPLMTYAKAVGAEEGARRAATDSLNRLIREYLDINSYVRHEEESISVFDGI